MSIQNTAVYQTLSLRNKKLHKVRQTNSVQGKNRDVSPLWGKLFNGCWCIYFEPSSRIATQNLTFTGTKLSITPVLSHGVCKRDLENVVQLIKHRASTMRLLQQSIQPTREHLQTQSRRSFKDKLCFVVRTFLTWLISFHDSFSLTKRFLTLQPREEFIFEWLCEASKTRPLR